MNLEDIIKKTFSLPKNFKISDIQGPGSIPGWDSLGNINLMSALESEYKIALDINEIVALESIGDIKKILKQKGAKKFE